MNKEVTTQGTKAVGAPIDFSFGIDNMIVQDLRLPKILLMQSTSNFVKDNKAKSGDIVDSFEINKLGTREAPLEIIPFYFTNTWTVKKKNAKGKFDFFKIEDRGGSDIQREYYETKDGEEYSNHRTLNIFCLIKNGNLTVPYLISLYNSSFKFGAQPFINKTQILKAEGKAPAHITWLLSHKDVTNDDGDKWLAFTIEAAKTKDGRDIPNTNEEVTYAYQAYKSLTDSLNSGAKIDMSDVATEEVPF